MPRMRRPGSGGGRAYVICLASRVTPNPEANLASSVKDFTSLAWASVISKVLMLLSEFCGGIRGSRQEDA
jgi:hypothetical protein